MDRKQLYADRLTELGWTSYRLAQEVVKLRQARGEAVTFRSIESSVRKCLEHPERSSAQANDDLITAMGGEIVIRWHVTKEIKL